MPNPISNKKASPEKSSIGEEKRFEEGRAEHPEIKELKKRIEELETRLQEEKEEIPEKEKVEKKEKVVKKEIKGYLKELQETPTSAPPVVDRDEVKEISSFPRSQQVGSLISLVFDKGLPEAISVARDLDNPAVLDEFHDTLVDRYYEELKKRNILK